MRKLIRKRKWLPTAALGLVCGLTGCSSWGQYTPRMPTVSWPSANKPAGPSGDDPRLPGVPINAPQTTSDKSSNPLASRSKTQGQAGESDELNLPSLMGKGRMLEKAGEWDKARETYIAAMRRYPKDPAPYHRMGVVADQQHRYLEAEQLFAEAIQRDPRNAEQFNDLGYCYFLQGQLVRAESAMLKATQLDPHNARFQNNYGMVLAHQGRIEPALQAFRQAGSEADAQYNLAFVFATKEQIDQAKICFRKALAADPQHEASRKALQSFDTYEQMPPEQRDVEMASNGTRWVPYRETGEAGAAAPAASGGSAVQQANYQTSGSAVRPARNAAQAQYLDSRGLMNLNRSGGQSADRR